MSVYNGERYLATTIDSVLMQSYSDFEFFITDDLSTDNSIAIIESFDDPRIVLMKNDNREGLTKNLNKMLLKAKGQYIVRIDADDICMKDRFLVQSKYLNKHKDIAVVGTYAEAIGDRSGILRSYNKPEEVKCCLLFYNCVFHPTVMFRNFCGLYYSEEFQKAQDYELWDRITCENKKISVIKKPLIQYRYHDGQISNNGVESQTKFADLIRIRALGRLDIHLNEKEKAIYLEFLNSKTPNGSDEMILLDRILVLIEKQNRKFHNYSDSALRKMISMERYALINKIENTPNNLDIVSKIRTKISFSYRLKTLRHYLSILK